MKNLECCIATEKDITFISETYHENIDSLHGVYRNEDVWKELLSDKNSTYYVVYAETSVAWFRIEVEDIAKEKGYKKVGIHTTEDNTAARALYLSEGYEVTEIGPCTTADGEERVGYTFQKEITENGLGAAYLV